MAISRRAFVVAVPFGCPEYGAAAISAEHVSEIVRDDSCRPLLPYESLVRDTDLEAGTPQPAAAASGLAEEAASWLRLVSQHPSSNALWRRGAPPEL
jgi:hypothetical protein